MKKYSFNNIFLKCAGPIAECKINLMGLVQHLFWLE